MTNKNEKLIFFVDDERSILHFMEYTFRGLENFSVRTFTTGEECLDSLNENPDLIILDHHMIDKSGKELIGLDVLDKIKTYNKEIPVIVLSASKEQEVVDEYISKGAHKFLTKDNFFVDILKDEIFNVLSE